MPDITYTFKLKDDLRYVVRSEFFKGAAFAFGLMAVLLLATLLGLPLLSL